MTCRQEVLQAARSLTARSPDGTFTPADIVAEMRRAGSRYPDSTIRTHVVAAMCIDAPDNHAVKYPDLHRVSAGRYALADSAATPNVPASTTAPAPPLSAAVHDDEDISERSGESSTQRAAEGVMVAELSRSLGVPLRPRRIHLADGSWVDVDAFNDNPLVLAEAWAHQGPPKSAQRNKVLADALKLQHVAADFNRPARLVLCFADPAAAAPFAGASWYAGAIRRLGIEILVVDLAPEWRQRIRAAQDRQYR